MFEKKKKSIKEIEERIKKKFKKPEEVVKTKHIREALKKNFKKKKKSTLIQTINKILTVSLFTIVLIYIVLLVFYVHEINNKDLLKYESGKRFYLFSSCSFEKRINCIKHTIKNQTLYMLIQNKFVHPIKIINISAGNCSLKMNKYVDSFDNTNISLNNCYSKNSINSEIVINYYDMQSNLKHLEKGKISTHFEITKIIQWWHQFRIKQEKLIKIVNKDKE